MCNRYAQVKHDYLYRGDVLRAVPFTRLDPGPLSIRNPFFLKQQKESDLRNSYAEPSFVDEQTPISEPTLCVARIERLDGLVITRTCEANKRTNARVIPPIVMVAPIRPFDYFPPDEKSKKPFYELVLNGFPSESGQEVGDCFRYMVLEPCAAHGLPDGGIVCFREMQPIPTDHLLAARKITRLSIDSVRVLDQRLWNYLGQREPDNVGDSAAEGSDSPLVAAYKARKAKEQQRRVEK